MLNPESGAEPQVKEPRIEQLRRENIPFLATIRFQNRLAHFMAPEQIQKYLIHDPAGDAPLSDLEIAYYNAWANKYADPEDGGYNGFTSFCNYEEALLDEAEAQLFQKVKKNLIEIGETEKNFDEEDVKVVATFIGEERGSLFESEAQVDVFLNEHTH